MMVRDFRKDLQRMDQDAHVFVGHLAHPMLLDGLEVGGFWLDPQTGRFTRVAFESPNVILGVNCVPTNQMRVSPYKLWRGESYTHPRKK